MRILLTGASGFIGRFVLREALQRGHQVSAVTRSLSTLHHQPGDLKVLQWDLGEAVDLQLGGLAVDVVVHLAAAIQGNAGQHAYHTVKATQFLLNGMQRAGIRRLVGVSSIAVLDYVSPPPMAVIDEKACRLTDPRQAGAYPSAKLAQETLFSAFGAEEGNSCVILRPGLVYDEKRLSAAHAGIVRGPLRLLAAHSGEVPTVNVNGLAVAIVEAAAAHLPGCEILHCLDDALPSQQQYISALRKRGELHGGVMLPWRALGGLCKLLRPVLSAAGRGDRVPEVFLPQGFAARLKPFRFSNARVKEMIRWSPGHEFA